MLAESIRRIARIAHRTLNESDSSQHELRELSRRISRLKRRLDTETNNPLARWVDSLDAQVSDRLSRTGARRVPAYL